MKSGNLVLNQRVFSQAGTYDRGEAMTIQRAVGKTLILLAVVFGAAL